ncbi:MAG: sirohydrochlorin cobaltochelatase [Methanoregulaceae archaeon]|jgi:sirohydrochlorin cobaltochelatase|nr:sirohydrochlorin cobaltochelatase [Methanoregulaceae archaeon]MDD5048156.1 sirohydrochlorin cobaltochelatase [Methanoregulaceae archaeon]MDD5684843.1 sirohydrochlorin cobaltochelatase [Methanoregulaceae archaeon]HOO90946.1 sirohydrochlorin cobaltochelatase [Syntrophales bacterium]
MVLDEVSGGSIAIGSGSGFPDIDQIVRRLRHIKAKKVVIAPFTLVPGIHAWTEITGERNENSWLKQLSGAGFTVTTRR